MSDWRSELATQIDSKQARVGVIGLGYVGLPVALHAVEVGFSVVGIDTDENRKQHLMQGRSYLTDISDEAIESVRRTERFTVTADYDAIRELDVVIICVPTPLSAGSPDLSYVVASAEELAPRMHRGMLVSLESTTYPGTTEEIVRPKLEQHGVRAGEDFALCFSPERIDPGNPRYGFADIPKIVGGLTQECTEVGAHFYATLVPTVIAVRGTREAEMTKLLENTYRQVNISLINEFAMVAHELDIDIWEVIEAAATKPFGFQPFYPGTGIGGHCIAVDPVFLTWRIRELGRAPFRLVELAREVDDAMPSYIVNRIAQVLNENGKPLEGSRVVVLGLTYKPDVPDIRESRALDILGRLHEAGADVAFHDPFVESVDVGSETLKRTELEGVYERADVVVVLTHHSVYDWQDVVAKAPLVFDARGVTLGVDDPKVIRL